MKNEPKYHGGKDSIQVMSLNKPVGGTFTIKEPHSIITKPIPYNATQEEMQKFVDEARALCVELERDVIEAAVAYRTVLGANKEYLDASARLTTATDKLIAVRKGDYE